MLLKEIDASYGLRGKTNYIFYMSEMEELPTNGHFRKMDRSKEVCRQLAGNIKDVRVMKYSEYGGERLDAASVGIVFPAHSWGISLAVFAFINHLKLTTGAYVYAVALGEKISADSEASVNRGLKPLMQFIELFERRTMGHTSDIYVRCSDIRRSKTEVIEDGRYHNKAEREEISLVLESMLFVNRKNLMDRKYLSDRSLDVSLADAEAMYESINLRARKRAEDKTYAEKFAFRREERPVVQKVSVQAAARPAVHMGNVFLDEDIWSGVRLRGVV